MKFFTPIALCALFGLSSATSSDYFTVTQLYNSNPSGYKGEKFTSMFKVEDKVTGSTLTTCEASWSTKAKAPQHYVKCDNSAWQWKYTKAYSECAFDIELAHSVISGTKNTTSYGHITAAQVPCNVNSGKTTKAFGCTYASSGASQCGLSKGSTLKVPIKSTTVTKTKKA